jgi:hypothetical protein
MYNTFYDFVSDVSMLSPEVRAEIAALSDRQVIELVDVALAERDRLAEIRSPLVSALRLVLDREHYADLIAGDPQEIVHDILIGIQEDARIEGEARRAIFDHKLLSAAEVADLLGIGDRANRRQYANRVRRDGSVVGIPHLNRYVYPAFQFDPERHAVRDAAAAANQLLGAATDPWGVASWWISPNARLNNSAPYQLLSQDRGDDVIRLAEEELRATD